jgi:hypothetical protein
MTKVQYKKSKFSILCKYSMFAERSQDIVKNHTQYTELVLFGILKQLTIIMAERKCKK